MRPQTQPKPYVLPDALPNGLRAVICGTAAGTVSAARGHYYAGPGNRFWAVLHQTGLTPRELSPSEFRSLCDHGLGLTDIAQLVPGADVTLKAGNFNVSGFIESIRQCQPEVVAFNGKKAARVFYGLGEREPLEYGPGKPLTDFPKIFVLPSTSGSARRYWDLQPWQQFARLLHEH